MFSRNFVTTVLPICLGAATCFAGCHTQQHSRNCPHASHRCQCAHGNVYHPPKPAPPEMSTSSERSSSTAAAIPRAMPRELNSSDTSSRFYTAPPADRTGYSRSRHNTPVMLSPPDSSEQTTDGSLQSDTGMDTMPDDNSYEGADMSEGPYFESRLSRRRDPVSEPVQTQRKLMPASPEPSGLMQWMRAGLQNLFNVNWNSSPLPLQGTGDTSRESFSGLPVKQAAVRLSTGRERAAGVSQPVVFEEIEGIGQENHHRAQQVEPLKDLQVCYSIDLAAVPARNRIPLQ